MARELGAVGEREARLVMNETHPSAHRPCACYRAGHRPTRRVLSDNSRSSAYSLAPRFTNEWKARLRHPSVPPEALPQALKRAFDTANTNKERHRRASGSSLIRSPSLAVADGDAEGRSASSSASAKVVPEY